LFFFKNKNKGITFKSVYKTVTNLTAFLSGVYIILKHPTTLLALYLSLVSGFT